MLNSLQKSDKDTNELIDRVRDYLFSIGIRTTRERAWDILQKVNHLPYEMLLEKNPEIKYQGQGRHVRQATHESQVFVIRNLGRYELKGLAKGSAVIKFIPSNSLKNKIGESVKVKN